MCSRTDRVGKLRSLLEDMHKNLDEVTSLARVKLLWLHHMHIGNKNYDVNIVDIDPPPRFVTKISVTAMQLRTHCDPLVIEIRRSLINDLFLIAARYSVITSNVINGMEPPEPEFHQKAYEGEILALGPFLTKHDKRFLDFFRRLRNSTVHYDGNHNLRNSLKFTFDGVAFITTEANLGRQIGYWFSTLFGIYDQIKKTFSVDKILTNPFLARCLDNADKH